MDAQRGGFCEISDGLSRHEGMNARSRLTVAALLAASSLSAHPNYEATQAIVVPLVQSNQRPPAASEVSITVEGDNRVITANGLPDHATGAFPNADNPNAIRAQRYRYTMPVAPKVRGEATPLRRQPFGIAVNGVLFDPGTAEMWQNDRNSGWHYEAQGNGFSLGLDTNFAHVQPNGAYHYHGVPLDLLTRLSGGREQMTLVGWAADGFPIYAVWGYRAAGDPTSGVVALKSSYRLKTGSRPTAGGQPGGTYDGVFVEDYDYVPGSGDLDECGGRFGVTPEFPQGTYHYVLTADYPYIPRSFRGTPDPSFAARGGPGGGRGEPPGRGGQPPRRERL